MGRIFLAAGHSIYDPGAVGQHDGETSWEPVKHQPNK